MSPDLTTSPNDSTADALVAVRFRDLFRWKIAFPPLAAALIGALFAILVYQIPATHRVDIGGYDSGYVRGFHDPDRTAAPAAPAFLNGSDGAARWTRNESYLLFPQAGLPAYITLRLRGQISSAPTPVTLLVNGLVVDRFVAGPDWQEHSIPVTAGLLKSDDVLVTIQTMASPLSAVDSRRVGVLLDQATYTTGPAPLLPYPSQVIYAAIASGLLWLVLASVLHQPPWWPFAIGLVLLMLAFLFLYRLQPPYPFPWHTLLPDVCLGLAALLAIRHAADLARIRALPDWLAVLVLMIWMSIILLVAQDHLVLSVPGVEKDFRVFATRITLDQIFQADGFYNLGYPLLLWLVRPLAEQSSFLAARLVAASSAALFLLATWSIARRRLGAGSALVALLVLACSPMVVQYALYLGSDMPFAALCALSLAFLDKVADDHPEPMPGCYWACAAAGMLAGMAFLVRHPGIALLLVGWVVLLIPVWQPMQGRDISRPYAIIARRIVIFTIACVLALAPQLIVNLRDTGQLFYSQQAKNVWLAVFGDGDWGRWGEAANAITLQEVLLQDPPRFWANLSGNLRAFIGTGAEDSSEFGRAIQLRLLGFPANWLAIAGLLGWLWLVIGRHSATRTPIPTPLFVWGIIYVPAIAIGFALPRFFLPLAPLYALSAAWALAQIAGRYGAIRAHVGLGIMLIWLISAGVGDGANYVLRAADSGDTVPGQPAATVALARLALATLHPGERLVVQVPTDDEAGLALAKYSAISQYTVAVPPSTDPTALRASGATLLIWSERLGAPPLVGPSIGQVGPYTLYRIDQP
jgi:4-amino-4-deoxy-L-arabinose transferase-like glycosyltransferase